MSEVDSTDLSARLHGAVDDHPVDVPDLLTPARSRRHRRRVLGGTAAVAVVVAGALAVSQLLSTSPRTALVAATPSPTVVATSAPAVTPSPAILTNDTVAARCAPQMVKYEAIHTNSYTPFPHPTDGWVVAHEAFAYHEGDLVALVERGRDSRQMALCRIPPAGQENAEVPYTAFDPSNLDEAGRTMLCSEELQSRPTTPTPGLGSRYQTTDLRGSTVVASDMADRTGILMLRLGAEEFLCNLFPVESSAISETVVTPLLVQPPAMKPWARGMAVLDTGSTYFSAAGWLPASAASIEFSVKGTVVHRVAPSSDGSWVAAWKVAGSATLSDATYTTRSASGAVLATGSVN
jgi:hypothetical protein